VSSSNRDTLTISLLIYIPFISSSCFISLARNSRIMLNRSRKSGHPYLIPDFRGNGFIFSPLSVIVGDMAVIYGCYHVEVHSFYS
jgi:hypothetical protein